MGERFKDIYRIPSARLQNWDYGWNAPYFVTICTQKHLSYFGEIVPNVETPKLGVFIKSPTPNVHLLETPKLGVSTNPANPTPTQMQLSEIGEIVKQYWNEIPHHFPFVELGEFVVMPNHVHGIIIIDKPDNGETHDVGTPVVETPKLGVSEKQTMELGESSTETSKLGVSTDHTDPAPRTAAASEKWNPGTLGVIINQYKRICTINARKIHADFAWQPRFHDHIIRNDESFQRISEYIQNNPLNWRTDKFYDAST